MDSDGWRFGNFLIDGAGYHSNPLIMENTVVPKFSKSIRMLSNSFKKNISPERLYHSNSFFVWQFRIMIETYRIKFGYWWLFHFFASVSLKMFFHVYKYLSTSCLYQFTLYIIYYIFYIYNWRYILYHSVVFWRFLNKS